jgi:dihydrofolate reductase
MKPFALVVAMDQEGGIGKGGLLPWHLPADLKHFKDITSGVSNPQHQNAVVMGRNTWESLPNKFRPLPKRVNIVLTRQQSLNVPPGVHVCGGLEQALDCAKHLPMVENIFIIGGGQLFAQAIGHPGCTQIFATHLQGRFGCDTFFPTIPGRFLPQPATPLQTENGITFSFRAYTV